MIPGPSSGSVGGAAEERSKAASTTSAGGSDSGYDSISHTTSGATPHHSQDFADGVVLPSRGMFERKVNLKLYGTETSQIVQHRFHDLHELFERPLLAYLIKANIIPRNITIKLRILGESEATAKPWIVVSCSKAESRKIRQFFNQPQIKADYQPSEPDSFQPSFGVLVSSRPPRPMAGTEIYSDLDEGSTICGRIIKIGEAQQSRFATLGGVIKVINSSGIVTLYGMTAGHILTQQPLGQYSFDQVDVPEEEDDEGFYSGEEEYELDNSVFESDEVQDKTRPVMQSTHLGSSWPRIGSVFVTSNGATTTDCDHDWALIILDRATDYRPNLLVPCDGEEKAARSRPLKENGKSTEDGSSRKVSLLSGTGGIKSGTLSTSLSFLMMGSAKAFTKTYTLNLSQGSVLNAGDCGSWVVDPSTCEVYGHVVASDAMGDIYVVPLSTTLRDMEKRLGAAVVLPTEADIHTWVARHVKAATEPSTVSATGKNKKVAFNDSKMDRVERPRDVQKLAERSSSQVSASIASTATKTSTSFVDHCISCNAQFKGTSENVRSDLRRHLRTCSKQGKDVTPEIKTSNSQNHKVAVDESLKKPRVGLSKDVQQGAKANVSTQLTNPILSSLRSMSSGMTKKPSNKTQQEDEKKGKSTSTAQGKKQTDSASSMKPTVTASPASTIKISKSKNYSDLPPSSRSFPSSSSALAGHTSRDLPRAPTTIRRQSLSTATPSIPSLHEPYSPPRLLPTQGNFHRRGIDPHHQPHNSHPGQVSYEGYNFTKDHPRYTGRKESWAIALMVPMPVSQKDLQDQIKRNRKKQTSALDEYNDENMNGFKRKQVDNLIRERAKLDGDFGYEYELASIKLDARKIRGKIIETLSMQVILKRQLRAGFSHEDSAGPSIDIHPRLPSQVMDLTGGDEPGNSRNYRPPSQHVGHGSGVVPLAGYPEYGAVPMPPVPWGVYGPGIPHDDNRHMPPYAVPHSFDPFNPPMQGINTHPPFQDIRPAPHPQSIPTIHHESHHTQAHPERVHKTDEKKKTPIIIEARHESRKKHDYPSNTSSSRSDTSFGFESLKSWVKTDATPDTDITDRSRERRQEKSSRSESTDRSFYNNSSNKDRSEGTASSTHEDEGVSYREHRRPKDPALSSRSLIPKPRDVSFDTFDWDQYSGIGPARDTSRHHRRSSLSPPPLERPSRHQFSSSSFGPRPYPRELDPRDLVPTRRGPTMLYPDSILDVDDLPIDQGAREQQQQEREKNLQLMREVDEQVAREQQKQEREKNLQLMREVDEQVRRRTETESLLDREIERKESELDERARWRSRMTDDGGLRRRDTILEADRGERWRSRTMYAGPSQRRDAMMEADRLDRESERERRRSRMADDDVPRRRDTRTGGGRWWDGVR